MTSYRRRNQPPLANSNDNQSENDDDFDFSKPESALNPDEAELDLPWSEFINNQLYPATSLSETSKRIRIWRHARDKIKQDGMYFCSFRHLVCSIMIQASINNRTRRCLASFITRGCICYITKIYG